MFSNLELYASVDAIISRLRLAGEEDWALEFKKAMYSDSMAGEILGKLRLKFIQFQATNIPKRLGLTKDTEIALNYLDKTLGPRPKPKP
jgi:hypothetical protein